PTEFWFASVHHPNSLAKSSARERRLRTDHDPPGPDQSVTGFRPGIRMHLVTVSNREGIRNRQRVSMMAQGRPARYRPGELRIENAKTTARIERHAAVCAY